MINLAILIPVFNDKIGFEKTMKALSCIKSDASIIVVDDGSSIYLETSEICGQNKVFKLRLPHNNGLVGALNAGLEKAFELGCNLIARLDAGDIPLPSRFERQIAAIQNNPKIGLVGVHTDFISPNGQKIYSWKPPNNPIKLRRFMHLQNPFVHSGVMMQTSVIKEAGAYNHDSPFAEDYDLFFRMSRLTEIEMIPETLMQCELNPVGISVRKRRQQVSSILKVKLKYFNLSIIESYIGVIRSLISYILPFKLINQAKNLMWK